jgi:serpin B
MPLAALVNATGEEFRPALLDALGASGLNPGDINWAASRMLYDLTNEKLRKNQDLPESPAESPIQIANAIFVDNNYTLRMEFAQLFMDFFRGEMMYVDFRSPDTVAAVNQWASDKTNGLIKKVVREFDPDTAAAIANAIYFSDNWTSQFNPSKTEQDIFYSPAGESTAYFMQLEKFDFSYFEDELTQAVSLGFSTGGGMSILLPKDGDATGLLSSMTSEYFERIQSDFIFARGKLSLPRFHIENNLDDLKGALTKLGVPLFDVVSAPLTGGLIEEEVPLWISEAVQVAMIEIDEEGATAAAVTIMVVPPGGLPPPETTFEMICNRPFVFILHGRTNDGGRQVLFTGVVNQP